MSAGREKGHDQLLAAYVEGELDGAELERVEAALAAHEDDRLEVEYQRAFARRLHKTPGEEAPADFADRVMAQVPALPGSWTHRVEVALGRFFQPALVTAAALAAWMVLAPTHPGAAPGHPLGLSTAPRGDLLAFVQAGSGGLTVAGQAIEAGDRKALEAGQAVQVGFGTPAQLKVPGGVVAVLHPGTRFSVREREVDLMLGRVMVKVTPGVADFRVRAPQATAHVIGTEFEVVAAPGSTSVEVVEGVVEVRREGATPVRLTAGQSASATEDGGGLVRGVADTLAPPEGLGEVVPSDVAEGIPGLDG